MSGKFHVTYGRRSIKDVYIVYAASGETHASLPSFVSIPHLLSMSVCRGRLFMKRETMKPTAETPIIACQTTRRLSANATRTVARSSGSSSDMTGMMEYATATPSGNCLINSSGRWLTSWVCRMATPIEKDQTCTPVVNGTERVGQKEKQTYTGE